MANNIMIEKYSSLKASAHSSIPGMPEFVNELFDLYYYLGPTRNLKQLYDTYLERCDSHGIDDEISYEEMGLLISKYKFDRHCQERNSDITVRAENKAIYEAHKEVLPEKRRLEDKKMSIIRRQVRQTEKMTEIAERIFEVLLDRVDSLKTTDLKTLETFGRLAKDFLVYAQKRQEELSGGFEVADLDKKDLMSILPYEFSQYMEEEAKKLLGEY